MISVNVGNRKWTFRPLVNSKAYCVILFGQLEYSIGRDCDESDLMTIMTTRLCVGCGKRFEK